jgi:predicted TIM-barrel fold metal-dependent hydrolase
MSGCLTRSAPTISPIRLDPGSLLEPDDEVPFGLATDLPGERSEEGGFVEQRLRLGEQQLAGARRFEAAIGAHEELRVEAFLDGAHMGACGGLADVEPLGRASQVLLFGDRHEGPELDEVDHHGALSPDAVRSRLPLFLSDPTTPRIVRKTSTPGPEKGHGPGAYPLPTLVSTDRFRSAETTVRHDSGDAGLEIVEPDLPIVDCHHHLWLRDGSRYLLDEFAADLASGHNVLATVYVECGSMVRRSGPPALRPVGEAEFVAGMAAMSDSGLFGPTRICAAFVGAADLTLGPAVDEVLDALDASSGGRLRGIRGSVPWDADPSINVGGRPHAPRGLLLDAGFRAGFARLARRNLVYDAWQYHPQLPELCSLADVFAGATIVVNHCGGLLGIGAYAGPETFARWRALVTDVARRPNTLMKLGGMSRRRCGFGFEEWPTPPTAADLADTWRPYVETCIELFGPARCMFESNFPPDSAAGSYRTVWNASS